MMAKSTGKSWEKIAMENKNKPLKLDHPVRGKGYKFPDAQDHQRTVWCWKLKVAQLDFRKICHNCMLSLGQEITATYYVGYRYETSVTRTVHKYLSCQQCAQRFCEEYRIPFKEEQKIIRKVTVTVTENIDTMRLEYNWAVRIGEYLLQQTITEGIAPMMAMNSKIRFLDIKRGIIDAIKEHNIRCIPERTISLAAEREVLDKLGVSRAKKIKELYK